MRNGFKFRGIMSMRNSTLHQGLLKLGIFISNLTVVNMEILYPCKSTGVGKTTRVKIITMEAVFQFQ